jgi:hypothetical protein
VAAGELYQDPQSSRSGGRGFRDFDSVILAKLAKDSDASEGPLNVRDCGAAWVPKVLNHLLGAILEVHYSCSRVWFTQIRQQLFLLVTKELRARIMMHSEDFVLVRVPIVSLG